MHWLACSAQTKTWPSWRGDRTLLVSENFKYVNVCVHAFKHRLSIPPSCLLTSHCQVQSERLAKEEKAANEEKELLEHAAVKIQLDIDAMRARYRGTAGALLAMIEDPHLTTLSEVVDSPLCGNGVTAGALPAVRESDLAQLKKLNQQAASQVDKLDRKLAERKAELESERAARQKLME